MLFLTYLSYFYFSVQTTCVYRDSLIVLFSDGNALLLNMLSPFSIYIRDKDDALAGQNLQESSGIQKMSQHLRMFIQPNGDIIEINNKQMCIKSAWEHFITSSKN